MPDETAPAPAPEIKKAPPPKVVDLDAGEGFGKDSVALMRPFRYRGMTYMSVSIRVPTGLDLDKHVDKRTGATNVTAMMCDLAELSEDVFLAMYAGDRNAVDLLVGKHLRGVPATSTTSSPTSGSAIPGTTTAS